MWDRYIPQHHKFVAMDKGQLHLGFCEGSSTRLECPWWNKTREEEALLCQRYNIMVDIQQGYL